MVDAVRIIANPVDIFYKDDPKYLSPNGNILNVSITVSHEVFDVHLVVYHVKNNTYIRCDDQSILVYNHKQLSIGVASLGATDRTLHIGFRIGHVSSRYNRMPFALGIHTNKTNTTYVVTTSSIVVKSKSMSNRTRRARIPRRNARSSPWSHNIDIWLTRQRKRIDDIHIVHGD
jgi:hypothetical protein